MGDGIFVNNVPAGVKEGPFVGEETAIIFLAVEKVVGVVVKVMVEMGEVAVFESRGLPQDEIFLGTFFLRPLPHCPFKFVFVSISTVFLFFFFVNTGDGAGVLGVAGFL